ncbi:MAG: hypothetical protein FJZ97_05215 [Chloroflexi bacterium]|nr:hypothetical protein [Chloroflexota bacterium]
MADILAIVAILVLVGAAQVGLVITFCLLFPARVQAASARLEQHPWRSLLMGGGAAIVLALPVVVLLSLPAGVAKFLGWALFVGALAISGIGASGLVRLLARRMASQGLAEPGSLGTLVRSCLALELAILLPVVGWFLVLPLATAAAFGASLHALRRPAFAPSAAPSTGSPG